MLVNILCFIAGGVVVAVSPPAFRFVTAQVARYKAWVSNKDE